MIEFRNFKLEAYDSKKHFVLVQRMKEDRGVYDFISQNFERWVEKMPVAKSGFEVNSPYVIVKDDKYIGMLGTFDRSNDGIVEFWYVIDKTERRKGYGDVILGEMTLYLIEEFSDVRLKIKKANETSKNRAVGNGYILDKMESNANKENDVYYYFGRKH